MNGEKSEDFSIQKNQQTIIWNTRKVLILLILSNSIIFLLLSLNQASKEESLVPTPETLQLKIQATSFMANMNNDSNLIVALYSKKDGRFKAKAKLLPHSTGPDLLSEPVEEQKEFFIIEINDKQYNNIVDDMASGFLIKPYRNETFNPLLITKGFSYEEIRF